MTTELLIYFILLALLSEIVGTVGGFGSSMLFVILGAFLSKYISSTLLELILAFFLITLSLLLLFFRNKRLAPTTLNAVLGGSASGFVAGLLGTGGAIRGVVLASYGLKTNVFIATSALIDLGIDASRSVVYSLNGFVHKDDLYLIPILLIVSITGTFIGKKIVNLLTEKQFQTSVLFLILITGIVTLYKTFPELNV